MRRTMHQRALLAWTIAIALELPTAALAHPHIKEPHPHLQQKSSKLAHKLAHKPKVRHATLAVTYTGEATKKASLSNSGFWLNGGSVDGAATFYRGFGLAANLSAVHAHDILSRTSVGKTTIVFGPRYTKDISEWMKKGKWIKKGDWFKKMPPSQVFAEALFGFAHGFDSSFPEGTSINPNANSGAFQLGAGLDLTLWRHLGVRAFELDYIRTGLPNGAANSQNDLRLSFGVNYRFDSHRP